MQTSRAPIVGRVLTAVEESLEILGSSARNNSSALASAAQDIVANSAQTDLLANQICQSFIVLPVLSVATAVGGGVPKSGELSAGLGVGCREDLSIGVSGRALDSKSIGAARVKAAPHGLHLNRRVDPIGCQEAETSEKFIVAVRGLAVTIGVGEGVVVVVAIVRIVAVSTPAVTVTAAAPVVGLSKVGHDCGDGRCESNLPHSSFKLQNKPMNIRAILLFG